MAEQRHKQFTCASVTRVSACVASTSSGQASASAGTSVSSAHMASACHTHLLEAVLLSACGVAY